MFKMNFLLKLIKLLFFLKKLEVFWGLILVCGYQILCKINFIKLLKLFYVIYDFRIVLFNFIFNFKLSYLIVLNCLN